MNILLCKFIYIKKIDIALCITYMSYLGCAPSTVRVYMIALRCCLMLNGLSHLRMLLSLKYMNRSDVQL
jgi:hypothetical protein